MIAIRHYYVYALLLSVLSISTMMLASNETTRLLPVSGVGHCPETPDVSFTTNQDNEFEEFEGGVVYGNNPANTNNSVNIITPDGNDNESLMGTYGSSNSCFQNQQPANNNQLNSTAPPPQTFANVPVHYVYQHQNNVVNSDDWLNQCLPKKYDLCVRVSTVVLCFGIVTAGCILAAMAALK